MLLKIWRYESLLVVSYLEPESKAPPCGGDRASFYYLFMALPVDREFFLTAKYRSADVRKRNQFVP